MVVMMLCMIYKVGKSNCYLKISAGLKMTKIEWHNGLNLGVKQIDSEHKKLISMINAVLNQLKHNDEAALDKLLGQLREYTVYHFKSEEKYMKEWEYPEIEKHRQIHKQLKERVKLLQSARFHKENVSWDEMRELLSGWLLEHILREDYKIAQFVNKSGK